MSRQHFLHGALILSLAGLISKFLGAFYRIPLARMIGGEGMGLYQMAYPLYTMILAISTAGVPVAVSLIVAERRARGDKAGSYRVFRVALTLLSISGAVCALLLFQSSNFLANRVLADSRAFLPLVAISPAVFSTAVVSAFRGYFQGQQQMLPTALSQVVEQLVRVGTVLIAAYFLFPHGVEFAAAGATFGAVTGSAAALLVLMLLYLRNRFTRENFGPSWPGSGESVSALARRIFRIAVPLSLGGLVMPLTQIVDATIVPLRLQAAGFSMQEATELFGYLAGMATTLINLPTIITVSLAMSLVPAISEAKTRGDNFLVRQRIEQALKVAVLFGLPAAAGLGVLANPISVLLYDVPEVARPLLVLAPAALILGLYQTTAGALQGLDRADLPVRNLLMGVGLKIVLNIYWTAIPQLNIVGAAMATVAGFTLALVLNLINLRAAVRIQVRWLDGFWKPLVATVIMAIAVELTYRNLLGIIGGNMAAVMAVFSGIATYGMALVVSGTVRKEDVRLIGNWFSG